MTGANMFRGYTLIELLVVISLIGLMAVLGIPAYTKYGETTSCRQKAGEIQELFNQMYKLKANPTSNTVTNYYITMTSFGGSDYDSFGLYSKPGPVLINTVKLSKTSYSLDLGADSAGEPILTANVDCSTTASKACAFEQYSSLELRFTIMGAGLLTTCTLEGIDTKNADDSIVTSNRPLGINCPVTTL
jgi:prepilin-type N-terminal cleavage/methylation domain-containing protein